ncbi:hypothetical protein G3R67_003425 [Salmonella enterica subsp. enterica serovar Agona]|nr:hypothetical protein [Salmonella enterica subsp. enterica serovar Agona]
MQRGDVVTTKVTKEYLAENISRLESYGDLSLNEEYQLKAYRLLIDLIPECVHDWYSPMAGIAAQCMKCGKME